MRTQRVSVKTHGDVLTALHTLTFPSDEQPDWREDGLAWITYDQGEPVAFLYTEQMTDGSWYFSRVGVMPAARGKGLQRKLMRLMERTLAGKKLISTTYLNPASANNFVRMGWLTFLPAHRWGAPDTIYWYKP